jgi:hypothetical protein
MSKIKVLVTPSDKTGVGKFRSIDPHVFLQNLYGDEFHVDIIFEPDMNDMNFWKQYQILILRTGEKYFFPSQSCRQQKHSQLPKW